MKEKLIELISISKNLSDLIVSKRNKFDERFNRKDIDANILKIRYQGSIASKTAINPLISKSKNELDLDLVIVIEDQNQSKYEKEKIVKQIKQQIEIIFNKYLKTKEKALSLNFEENINGEKIFLGMDFVFIFEKNNRNYVWNNVKKDLEYSNPFKIIDEFSKINETEKINLVKLIKALRDVYSIKGLKSIIILNSALSVMKKGFNLNYLSLVEQLKNDLNLLEKNNYIESFADKNDRLLKSNDFNYKNTIDFLIQIKNYNEDDLIFLIQNAIKKSKNSTINKINSSKPSMKIHFEF